MTTNEEPIREFGSAAAKSMPRRVASRGQSGLTLVELMISMVIVSIAVAAAFALGFSMVNSYREHRRLMEVERTARVSMEIVADTIRLASAGVPTADLDDLVWCSPFAPLAVENNTNAPDELHVIHASGGVLTALRATYDTGDAYIDVFIDEAFNGTELQAGDFVIITNGETAHFREIERLASFTTADHLLLYLTDSPCSSTPFPAGGFAPGSLVIRAQSTHFYIEDGATTGNIPTLMMKPDDPNNIGNEPAEPIAQGIEDMQVAVGVDANDDGALEEGPSTTDEWYYNVPGDSAPPLIIDDPPRAIRLTLVARSLNETSSQAASARPGAEDRTAANAPDVFRRRVLSSVLEIRNLEGSPP